MRSGSVKTTSTLCIYVERQVNFPWDDNRARSRHAFERRKLFLYDRMTRCLCAALLCVFYSIMCGGMSVSTLIVFARRHEMENIENNHHIDEYKAKSRRTSTQ